MTTLKWYGLRARGSDEIGGHFVGLPLVSRIYLGNLSVLADQYRAQPVNNLTVLLVISQPKEVGGLAHLLRRTRGELPMGEVGIDTSYIILAVTAPDLLRHATSEVVARAHAILGPGTARVDEGEQQRFPEELMEVDRLATLVA